MNNVTDRNLDEVLKCLNEAYNNNRLGKYLHDEVRQLMVEKYKKAPSDLVLAVDYLYRNGMLSYIDGKYAIQYEGKIFIEEGGYKQERIRNDNALASENRRETLLVVGSWVAGVGTSVLAVVEIVKYLKWVKTIEMATCLFLFVAIVCIISIITIMALSIFQHKQKK